MSREGRTSRNRVSVLSWMWTIVLACIPGVNIIVCFLLAFLAKRQPKRTFAIAALWLMLIVAVLIFAAFLILPGRDTILRRMAARFDALAGRRNAAGAVTQYKQKEEPCKRSSFCFAEKPVISPHR